MLKPARCFLAERGRVFFRVAVGLLGGSGVEDVVDEDTSFRQVAAAFLVRALLPALDAALVRDLHSLSKPSQFGVRAGIIMNTGSGSGLTCS